jgi:hypothetical protein
MVMLDRLELLHRKIPETPEEEETQLVPGFKGVK